MSDIDYLTDESWMVDKKWADEEGRKEAARLNDPFHPARRSKGDKHKNKARRNLCHLKKSA